MTYLNRLSFISCDFEGKDQAAGTSFAAGAFFNILFRILDSIERMLRIVKFHRVHMPPVSPAGSQVNQHHFNPFVRLVLWSLPAT